ncbi:MAG TPA: hypothetical protein VHK91_11350 [Flavisolibacter sp.]|jgi:hypothetical protein|nr:hypothetical protein [Flavisolibacter sp.]
MSSEHKNDQNSQNRENDPSKAMDSKQEVAQSNDEKTDQDFPGYPHYPAKEDIMDQRTDSHRADRDVENLPNGSNTSGVSQRFAQDQAADVNDARNEEMGTPQNVSNEDLDSEDRPGTDLNQATAS